MALLLPSSMNQQFITEFPSCFFFRPCLSYLMNIYLASLLTRPRNLAISLWIARHFSLLLSLAFQLCLECLHLFFFSCHFRCTFPLFIAVMRRRNVRRTGQFLMVACGQTNPSGLLPLVFASSVWLPKAKQRTLIKVVRCREREK